MTDKITVALIPQAADALRLAAERREMTRTDVVNRALTLHGFIDAQLAEGRELLLRDPCTGAVELVSFPGDSEWASRG